MVGIVDYIYVYVSSHHILTTYPQHTFFYPWNHICTNISNVSRYTYEGQFKDDHKDGTGTLQWPDGRTYSVRHRFCFFLFLFLHYRFIVSDPPNRKHSKISWKTSWKMFRVNSPPANSMETQQWCGLTGGDTRVSTVTGGNTGKRTFGLWSFWSALAGVQLKVKIEKNC